jgi:hypothetical protein
MMPMVVPEQAPVPQPAYHRAQARLGAPLHIDALTLVRTLHLLTLCRLAVRLAHRRCPPPLPAGPGGALRTYGEGSLLLISLLRTLWRLSYQDMHDWLADWPDDGPTPMPPSVMRPLVSRLSRAYLALSRLGLTPSSFCFLPPTSMMPRSRVRGFNGRCVSTSSAH